MKKDNVKTILLFGIVIGIIIVVVASIMIYSGMNPALTVIDSSSMEHSDEKSQLNVIDTGDMVVMVDPDKTSVTTYVEGYQSGYSKFGDYGDVIIYYREGKNPVIHRAILWLDYNNGKWSAPALKDYPSDLWYTSDNSPWNDLTGTLSISLTDDYENGTKKFYSITLKSLELSNPHSGYLTKGDNNQAYDQTGGISNDLIPKDRLKAVAGIEIPWLGCIKLKMNDKNVDMIKGNSIPCLAVAFIDIIAFLIILMLIIEYAVDFYYEKKKKNEPVPIVRKSKRKA